MIKYLSTLSIVSTLLISGCIDLSDSDSEPDSEQEQEQEPKNELFGAWDTPCASDGLDTFIISEESLIIKGYTFENPDCTGTAVERVSFDYAISYGDQVTVSSGVEATQVIITDDNDGELLALELIYRDGNNLYLGDDTSTENTYPTDIDFDFVLTLQ